MSAGLSETKVPSAAAARSEGPNGDPVLFRMSNAEMERRWSLSRKILRERKLDAVIALGFDDSLSGYVRWFCDFGATAYMKVAVFYAERPMTIVEHGALDGARDVSPMDPNTPGVARVLTTSSFKAVAATLGYEAEAVAVDLRCHRAQRVGLLRSGAMPAGFVDRLKILAPEIEWSDETATFDRVKAVKSPTELDSLRQACAIQDEVFAQVLDKVRPGVREVDLLSFAERELRLRGALDGTLASGSAPAGKAASLRPWRMQNRTLQQGDCFTILLELSNAAGYYGEMARQVVIGQATEEHKAAFAVLREAQDATVAAFRPGASCAAIAAAHDRLMEARGHAGELRLFSHSQGYDMVESPMIRADETMTLEANMFLSCHPAIGTPNLFAFLCDNFIIHADGPAERVHKTAQKIFEV